MKHIKKIYYGGNAFEDLRKLSPVHISNIVFSFPPFPTYFLIERVDQIVRWIDIEWEMGAFPFERGNSIFYAHQKKKKATL